MVLINLNRLSDQELRYIAQQENLEHSDTLSREELLEVLHDYFEDETQETTEITEDQSAHKFVRGLTSVGSEVNTSYEVRPLPEEYPETEIHIIPRDPNWAYCFWSINPGKKEELENKGASVVLRVSSGKGSYDISVGFEDKDWNIELPWSGTTYRVRLVTVTDCEEVIAKSSELKMDSTWLEEHPEDVMDNRFCHLGVSAMVSKTGNLINNTKVGEIIRKAMEDKK